MEDPYAYLPDSYDPQPPPNRRWLRVQHLLQHNQRPSYPRDDATTWRAWQYHSEYSQAPDRTVRAELERVFPDVAEVSRFTDADPLRRAELEARLLADQNDAAIASRMDLTPDAVAMYHDLHFNVRPFLQVSIYINLTVLGPRVYHGMTPDDHELLLKLFGYLMGPLAIDSYLDYLADPPIVPPLLSQLDDAALAVLEGKLRKKALILSLTVPAEALKPEVWLSLADSRLPDRRAASADGVRIPPAATLRPTLDKVERALDRLAVLEPAASRFPEQAVSA